MNSTFSNPRVVIRPTLPSDTPDILEFCKLIWGGNDYLPSVWDEWLHSPKSHLFTAEYGGRAVGVTRVSAVAPRQWWFEGFRVDPAYQGLGIGTQIHEYIVNWWLRNGEGAVRLWTNSKRVKIHHLCEKTGFSRVLEHAVYAAPGNGLGSGLGNELFTPVRAEEVPAATEFAQTAGSLPLQGGKLDLVWQTATPNETSLRELISGENMQLFWWREKRGVLGWWENDEQPEDIHAMLALAACERAELTALLREARQLAQAEGFQSLAWNAPVSPELAPYLAAAGFTRVDDDSNYEYERLHPTRP
jgi:GNAT superfamily N-acetyltransferase